MQHKGVLTKIFLVAAGALLSFSLALGGWAFYANTGCRTPGILVWDVVVAPHRKLGWAALGDVLSVQLFVDFLFSFAIMCGLFFAVTKLRHRPKSRI
jgi:hypothetical protein